MLVICFRNFSKNTHGLLSIRICLLIVNTMTTPENDDTNHDTDAIYREGYSEAKSKDSPNRFQLIQDRKQSTEMSAETMKQLLKGEDNMNVWRGIPFRKFAVERVLYPCLIDELQPGTIIETGSYRGGSAVWLADVAACHREDGLAPTKVVGIDLCLDNIHPNAKKFQEKNPGIVTFVSANSKDLAEGLTPDLLATCPKPWLIIEDCHYFFKEQLDFFHSVMSKGDYLIVEDCNSEHIKYWEENWPDKVEMQHQSCKPGVLTKFMESHSEYRVDSYYQDAFAYNFAKSQNSIVKKMDD